MSKYLRAHERLDDLQIGGYEIIQDPRRFCFGIDAVLLSGFAKAKETDTVADLCTGTGVVAILMAAKTTAKKIIGVEVQEESADMAWRSVKHDHLENRVEILCADINDLPQHLAADTVDVITVNPPYMRADTGLKNPDEATAIARHEILCTLDDILRESARLLKPGGHFYMVHRPNRLAEILGQMRAFRIEPKRMRLVQPYADKEPTMVLVEGVRGAKPEIRVEKPLVVYEKPNVYTEEILEIYGRK